MWTSQKVQDPHRSTVPPFSNKVLQVNCNTISGNRFKKHQQPLAKELLGGKNGNTKKLEWTSLAWCSLKDPRNEGKKKELEKK